MKILKAILGFVGCLMGLWMFVNFIVLLSFSSSTCSGKEAYVLGTWNKVAYGPAIVAHDRMYPDTPVRIYDLDSDDYPEQPVL